MTLLAADGGWLDKILENAQDKWQVVLLVGQIVFFSRFAVQWWASERMKRVVMPVSFWWLSILGAAISLVALVAKHEPVLILAQVCGLVIYFRNLVLHRRSVGGPAAAP